VRRTPEQAGPSADKLDKANGRHAAIATSYRHARPMAATVATIARTQHGVGGVGRARFAPPASRLFVRSATDPSVLGSAAVSHGGRGRLRGPSRYEEGAAKYHAVLGKLSAARVQNSTSLGQRRSRHTHAHRLTHDLRICARHVTSFPAICCASGRTTRSTPYSPPHVQTSRAAAQSAAHRFRH
jgi:hypothetical protein